MPTIVIQTSDPLGLLVKIKTAATPGTKKVFKTWEYPGTPKNQFFHSGEQYADYFVEAKDPATGAKTLHFEVKRKPTKTGGFEAYVAGHFAATILEHFAGHKIELS